MYEANIDDDLGQVLGPYFLVKTVLVSKPLGHLRTDKHAPKLLGLNFMAEMNEGVHIAPNRGQVHGLYWIICGYSDDCNII